MLKSVHGTMCFRHVCRGQPVCVCVNERLWIQIMSNNSTTVMPATAVHVVHVSSYTFFCRLARVCRPGMLETSGRESVQRIFVSVRSIPTLVIKHKFKPEHERVMSQHGTRFIRPQQQECFQVTFRYLMSSNNLSSLSKTRVLNEKGTQRTS